MINVTSLTISQQERQDPVEIPLEEVGRNRHEPEIDLGHRSLENDQSRARRRRNTFKAILPYLRIKKNKLGVGSTTRRKQCCSTCCSWATGTLLKVIHNIIKFKKLFD